MPLAARSISPVDLSANRLGPTVKRDELLCVANGTLANLTRQLSSLSRNAEQIFSDIHREVLKIDHRTNSVIMRMNKMAQKVARPDAGAFQENLENNVMRKAFKSYNAIDQHSLDRQTLPDSLRALYARCESPPHLDQLNPYREDPKSALRYYTDPSYFFDLWRQEMLKECGSDALASGRRLASEQGRAQSRSPLRKRRQPPTHNQQVHHQQAGAFYHPTAHGPASYQTPPQFGGRQVLHFPVEYQAPQHAVHAAGRLLQPPPGMSLHADGQVAAIYNYDDKGAAVAPMLSYHQHIAYGGQEKNMAPTAPHLHNSNGAANVPVPDESTKELNRRMGDMLLGEQRHLKQIDSGLQLPASSTIEDAFREDDDDEFPPPPPVLSSQHFGILASSSSRSTENSANPQNNYAQQSPTTFPAVDSQGILHGAMQYLPSGGQSQNMNAPPPPPPPPDSAAAKSNVLAAEEATMVASMTVASFAASHEMTTPIPAKDHSHHEDIGAIDGEEGASEAKNSQQPKAGNLLMQIQSGIQLKKVERQRELEEVNAANEMNDVAAILRRRMEHVLGCNDESSESSNSNDGEWD